MKKIVCLFITFSLLAKDVTLEIPYSYSKNLANSTNKYSFATNNLAKLYTNYPALADNLTVITIKQDPANQDQYLRFFRSQLNRSFNTNLIGAGLSVPSITINTRYAPPPIQIQSYGGADPSRP